MCRIAGVINPFLSINTLKVMAKEMCTILQHGGPDDEGVYCCERLSTVFGHRRLSIIDISAAGHQPMNYADGRYTISYNGEKYNYRELKEKIKKKGDQFK